MDEPLYIWISRWEDFQHYKPERDRAPVWIKTYTKQLSDDRYLDLTPGERALLHDLRAEFARARSDLRADTKRLSSRLRTTVYRRQLESLNHAGFIDIISRPVLEQRLERLYASRAPARSLEEEEKEIDTPKAVNQSRNGSQHEEPPLPDYEPEFEDIQDIV